MKARLLLVVVVLAAPAYLALDVAHLCPVALRDRPWPFMLAALVVAVIAARTAPRLRVLALALAVVSSAAVAAAAYARYRLPPSSATAGVGQPLPDLTLRDESGQPVRLRALTSRPALLVWFRGSWCPYCRQQLAELATELAHRPPPDFRVLAVAPDPPEPLARLKRDLKLPFTLLSDPDAQLVNRCELGHCVAILDGNGIVRWGVVSGNWERDLPARALVQATYRQR